MLGALTDVAVRGRVVVGAGAGAGLDAPLAVLEGRTVAAVDEVTVLWGAGREDVGAGLMGEGERREGGEEGVSSSGSWWISFRAAGSTTVGEGEFATNGSSSAGVTGGCRSRVGASSGASLRLGFLLGLSAKLSVTLSLLVGRAKGLLGRSAPAELSWEGRLTKGLANFSGESEEGDDGLVGEAGVPFAPRTVEGERVNGDSGLRNGEARGELKDSRLGCEACGVEGKLLLAMVGMRSRICLTMLGGCYAVYLLLYMRAMVWVCCICGLWYRLNGSSIA